MSLYYKWEKEKLTSKIHSIPLRYYTHHNFSLTSNVEYVEECLPNFLPNWDGSEIDLCIDTIVLKTKLRI